MFNKLDCTRGSVCRRFFVALSMSDFFPEKSAKTYRLGRKAGIKKKIKINK